MTSQIHTKFTTQQVKELLEKYLKKEVERKYIQEILTIGKSRFFEIIRTYRSNPEQFSVEYKRSSEAKRIAPEIQNNIIKELAIDQIAIKNKDIPLYKYNYSYIQKRLNKKYGQSPPYPPLLTTPNLTNSTSPNVLNVKPMTGKF